MKKSVYIVIAILSLVNCQLPTMPEKIEIVVRYEVTAEIVQEPTQEPTPNHHEVWILYNDIFVESYTASDEAEWQYFKRIMPLHLENLGSGYSPSLGSSTSD